MDASTRYHFADFTLDNFRKLVRMAKREYAFRLFDDFDREEKFVLWRHDVDMSVHRAVRLARIEAEEGVRATYFLHLHSEFYNLFELEIKKLVRELISLGHALGLHFDADYGESDRPEDLEHLLAREKRILEDYFSYPVRVFSFHNISSPAIEQFSRDQCAGMVNTNGAYFKSEVQYCSDSNGYWRHARLEDVLRQASHRRLQVLTHPEMWQDAAISPHERVERCICGRADKTRESYRAILRKTGRKDVGR